MPRLARLDFEGGLYHVIGRGVERRAVFRSPRDCGDFENRLAVLTVDEAMRLFAYVLMPNHFHLVVRREGARRLGHFMGRLLTGYAGSFNLRYRRVGHLFQNRYKSVLCDEDAYLLQLVRYVHLNPVRARIVDGPEHYEWSSHNDYLGEYPRAWLDTAEVLERIGGFRAYRRFVADGVEEGQRPDLCGSTTRRQWPRSTSPTPAPERSRNLWFGGQVLGDNHFATRAAKRTKVDREVRYELEGADLPELARRVARATGVEVEALVNRGRSREVCEARRALVELAVVKKGIRPVEVARYLGISRASVAAYRRKLTT